MERDRDWTAAAAAAAIEKQTGLETERERDKGLVEFSRWNQISHWLTCNHERRRHIRHSGSDSSDGSITKSCSLSERAQGIRSGHGI